MSSVTCGLGDSVAVFSEHFHTGGVYYHGIYEFTFAYRRALREGDLIIFLLRLEIKYQGEFVLRGIFSQQKVLTVKQCDRRAIAFHCQVMHVIDVFGCGKREVELIGRPGKRLAQGSVKDRPVLFFAAQLFELSLKSESLSQGTGENEGKEHGRAKYHYGRHQRVAENEQSADYKQHKRGKSAEEEQSQELSEKVLYALPHVKYSSFDATFHIYPSFRKFILVTLKIIPSFFVLVNRGGEYKGEILLSSG